MKGHERRPWAALGGLGPASGRAQLCGRRCARALQPPESLDLPASSPHSHEAVLLHGAPVPRTWRVHVEGTPGRHTWRAHLEGICGGRTWKAHLKGVREGTPGGRTWRAHVEGAPGRHTGRAHLEDARGGHTWKAHLEDSRLRQQQEAGRFSSQCWSHCGGRGWPVVFPGSLLASPQRSSSCQLSWKLKQPGPEILVFPWGPSSCLPAPTAADCRGRVFRGAYWKL